MKTGFDFGKLLAALEQKDVEGLLACFADGVELHVEDEAQPVRGKDTLRRFAEAALPALGKLKVLPVMLVQKGDSVAALVQLSADYTRDIVMPGGARLSSAGKHLSTHAALFATLNEAGQIVWMHRVRDNASVMRQLGLSPEQLEELREEVSEGLGQE